MLICPTRRLAQPQSLRTAKFNSHLAAQNTQNAVRTHVCLLFLRKQENSQPAKTWQQTNRNELARINPAVDKAGHRGNAELTLLAFCFYSLFWVAPLPLRLFPYPLKPFCFWQSPVAVLSSSPPYKPSCVANKRPQSIQGSRAAKIAALVSTSAGRISC